MVIRRYLASVISGCDGNETLNLGWKTPRLFLGHYCRGWLVMAAVAGCGLIVFLGWIYVSLPVCLSVFLCLSVFFLSICCLSVFLSVYLFFSVRLLSVSFTVCPLSLFLYYMFSYSVSLSGYLLSVYLSLSFFIYFPFVLQHYLSLLSLVFSPTPCLLIWMLICLCLSLSLYPPLLSLFLYITLSLPCRSSTSAMTVASHAMES